MKKVLRLVLCLAVAFMLAMSISKADVTDTETALYVNVTLLNGRSAPRKKASVEARFDYGDPLIATGDWSPDYQWVEVYGGETGTVWVHINYISERPHYTVTNENNGKVKVRKWPVIGKVTGYIHHGQTVEIEQKVLNWGKTKYGWVDLDYFIEEVE